MQFSMCKFKFCFAKFQKAQLSFDFVKQTCLKWIFEENSVDAVHFSILFRYQTCSQTNFVKNSDDAFFILLGTHQTFI